MSPARISQALTGLAWLLAGVLWCGVVWAQSGAAQLTQEYFVQQAADEALLIRIDAFEAEFESSIRGEDAELLLRSGILNNRIAPIFQYVHPPASARQLGIEVLSSKQTARSEFELQLTRLTVWDERSSAVSQAYQMLSFGMQKAAADSAADWTVRIDNLSNAARVFQQYGMNEMRLWSMYLAAHLVQYQLHDYGFAYRMSREIMRELNVTRLADIELATWQLQSAALIGLKQMDTLPVTARDPDPVQTALAHTAQLAASMGALQAQAQALDFSGSEYAVDGRYSEALEQFQRTVEIADSVGEAELSKHSRESMVQIHAMQGNAPASSKVLQQIETRLTGQGTGDELALNLLAQGRLLIRTYRYAEAREVLTQALGYQNYSAIRKQLDFELARVFYQTGRLDESLALLQQAGVSTHRQKRANSILDNGQAMALLAAVQRGLGAFAEMREARKTQGLYDGKQGHYLYQQGLDELATGGTNKQRAQTYFRQSLVAARQLGDRDLANLSLLQYCLLADGEPCSRANTETAYQGLVSSGVPRNTLEAMYLRARMTTRGGQQARAIDIMHALVDEIHLLRHSLPGVLGAWYQERHEALFEFYLVLLTDTRGQSSTADTDSLLALSKIRLIDRYDPAEPGPDPDVVDVQALRAQLAERAAASPGSEVRDTADAIEHSLTRLRESFRQQFAYLSQAGVRTYLRSLANDEMLLTYHVSPSTAQVWVGHKGRVVRRKIDGASTIYRQLQQAHGLLANTGEAAFIQTMDSLGKRLLSPVADLLDHTIYWIPAGPLLGLPLDAMRLRGHYLAEKHSVANVLSFPAKPDPGQALQAGPINSVFVAGYPQDFSASYATQFDTTDEIRAMVDIFVGPGLNIVQGAALLPDEFQDQRFKQADLAHLAMPGVIDLNDPTNSSLELSGTEDGPQRTLYRLENIQPGTLNTRLVFLSSTKTTGVPKSAFSSRPGLIGDFTGAGAQAVIADLWDNAGQSDEKFLVDFYRELRDSDDIARSLHDAKSHYLKNNRSMGLYGWAGYQLFIP